MSAKKTGVLLVNLGSPEAPTAKSVRRFLRDFLWDRRVVNLPRPVWWVVLHFFVLPFRPRRSALAYRKIWDIKGSPLIFLTRQLTGKIASRLQAKGVITDYAMRYGEPQVGSRLAAFKAQGMEKLIVLPLYPQYSSTTTASVYDAAVSELNGWFHLPDLHFISDYHRHPRYIAAVAESIRQSWREHGKNDLLLMSFHGLPEVLTRWGDPYFYHCRETAELIAEQLGLGENEWLMVFQSRFGKAEWLKPYCLETLQGLPAQGIKKVDVVCPGFAVDCLETLEEIAMENKAVFINAGGSVYHYIPALNDSEAHADALAGIIDSRL
ncbi:ferrochelatase [Methylosarcina fibrata]|uniref:ferrochelatase n=1 Tax=Methylosarcina fibrata TaxID=105972 RepID=UPI00037F729A|nr:ferrochelatase [Methylosarcina fibrata]